MSRGRSRPPPLPRPGLPRPVSQAPDSPGPCSCHGPSLYLFDWREEGRAGRGRREGARAGRGPWPRRARRAPAPPPRLEQSQREARGVGSPRATFLQAGGRQGIVARSRQGRLETPWLPELLRVKPGQLPRSPERNPAQQQSSEERKGEGTLVARSGRREARLSEGRTEADLSFPRSGERWLAAPRRGPQLGRSARKSHQFYCLLDYIEKNTKICIKNINPACWTCMVIISILYHFSCLTLACC